MKFYSFFKSDNQPGEENCAGSSEEKIATSGNEEKEKKEEIVVEKKNLDQNLEENMDKLSEDKKEIEKQIKNYSNYVCRICKFNSKNEDIRVKHKISHNVRFYGEVLKHKCLICKREFEKLDNLISHYVFDHNLLFDCLFCTLKYKTKKCLIRHMRRVHLNGIQ